MKKIACIGWGSLIWNPGQLLVHNEWFNDGPYLPVEFLRVSKNERLTLVLSENVKPLRTLWAVMATVDLSYAKISLATREEIKELYRYKSIQSVTANESVGDSFRLIIQEWIIRMNLDAAIWTNLSPKFDKKNGSEPTIEEAISYLKSLDNNKRKLAEEYIRKAPKQIDTEYRRKFETEFGWTCISKF